MKTVKGFGKNDFVLQATIIDVFYRLLLNINDNHMRYVQDVQFFYTLYHPQLSE